MERKSLIDLILGNLEAIVFALLLGTLVVLFLGFVQGCKVKQCDTIGITRCNGDHVEVCTTGHRWRKFSNCQEYGGICTMYSVKDSTDYTSEPKSHDVAICTPVPDATAPAVTH